ncbi:SlyX family protein [Thalassobius sp. MITS945101]|uniref:SlyX family protein n=1 Tax=Thalassobius sp. MITS945101 TaxID=3096994 RepID=UPI00399A3C3B
MQKVEEQLAHLTRTVEDLSDVVAAQASEIELLTRRVVLLMEREAQREADAGSHIYGGPEKPPHY